MWNKDNRVFSSGPRHLRKRQKEKKEGQGNEGVVGRKSGIKGQMKSASCGLIYPM